MKVAGRAMLLVLKTIGRGELMLKVVFAPSFNELSIWSKSSSFIFY